LPSAAGGHHLCIAAPIAGQDAGAITRHLARGDRARRRARAAAWRPERDLPVRGPTRARARPPVPDLSSRQFIEARPETPFLQGGETKNGKPILDRVISYESTLPEAARCALLSFDASMRSNLSVAPPIDLLWYRADASAPMFGSTSQPTMPSLASYVATRARASSGCRNPNGSRLATRTTIDVPFGPSTPQNRRFVVRTTRPSVSTRASHSTAQRAPSPRLGRQCGLASPTGRLYDGTYSMDRFRARSCKAGWPMATR
jgi:hypothetical protein